MGTIIVNGTRREIQAPEDAPLLYVLRNELKLTGPQFGCGMSQCGACSVLVDGAEPTGRLLKPFSALPLQWQKRGDR